MGLRYLQTGDRGKLLGSHMSPLEVPRPAWMTEDVVLLEEQARRFVDAEFVPHLERWNEAGMYEPRRLDQGRRRRAAVCVDAGGIWRRRRQLRP